MYPPSISNTGVLFDAIVEQDLKQLHAISQVEISRELRSRYHVGARGQCPLHLAVLVLNSEQIQRFGEKARWGVEVVKWLLRSGAELNVVNSLGRTPLMSAIQFGNVDIVSLLVSAGANIAFESDCYGRSALHLACEYNRNCNELFKMVQYLIKKRCVVTHRDKVCL